jgi:hypothetical protein
VAAPIPLLAPVTSAAVPVSFDVMGVSVFSGCTALGQAPGRRHHVVHVWQRRRAAVRSLIDRAT